MIRRLLCLPCATSLTPLQAADKAGGWKERRVHGWPVKPKKHFMIVNGTERINLPNLLCDNCACTLDGKEAVAITYWKGQTAAKWEHEFFPELTV